MSSISAEMNALADRHVVDIYKRHVRTAARTITICASRLATVFWGVYAVVCAQYVKRLGSLVEAVNMLGSLFYGGMLGVFVLAFFFPRVGPRGAFWACSSARPSSSRAGCLRASRSSGTTSSAAWRSVLTGVLVSSLEPKRR